MAAQRSKLSVKIFCFWGMLPWPVMMKLGLFFRPLTSLSTVITGIKLHLFLFFYALSSDVILTENGWINGWLKYIKYILLVLWPFLWEEWRMASSPDSKHGLSTLFHTKTKITEKKKRKSLSISPQKASKVPAHRGLLCVWSALCLLLGNAVTFVRGKARRHENCSSKRAANGGRVILTLSNRLTNFLNQRFIQTWHIG